MAIIDDGFKAANQLSGDLPTNWNFRDFTEEGMYAGDSVHGTACAEIIHDVAPDAELTLLKVGDLLDFENAVDHSRRAGIDIISQSLFWLAGFGNGRGLACNIVNDAAEHGILWVNAAGNSAKSHYSGFWNDSDSDGWHNYGGGDEQLSFQAAEGDSVTLILTWNDWPTTSDNYDFYLYKSGTSADSEPVGESTDIQDSSGGIPVERIKYKVEESGTYGIAISSLGARPQRLKLWSFDHGLLEHSAPANSIEVPADASGVMSVGAIHPWDWATGRIADYSSRGPTTDGRVKPDLAAPSGVSTVSYGVSTASHGTEGYFGTSAAAPHVAGAAALIKSANPSYSLDDLWDALIAATVDIDAFGKDNNTGYGKLVLPLMERQEVILPQITSLSPTSVRYGQVVTISGTGFGADRGTGRVVFYGGTEPSSSQYVNWSDTRIQVRVPTGARTGDMQVITATGSDTARLTVTSPWVSSVSPRSGRTNTLVTVTGSNFGASRGNNSVRIGSRTISSYSSWSSTTIRFRIPVNTRSGNLSVRTSEGTSNFLSLEVTSPYLSWTSPTRVKPGDRLTLTGRNFRSTRGLGSVVFTPSVRPSSGDYVSWSDRRIVVEVPDRAKSGDVKVITSHGSSGTRRIEVQEIDEPRITSVSPTRVRYNQILTIRGTGFGASRGAGKVVFFGGTEPRFYQYVSWSETRIQVRVPTGARTGNLQVVSTKGRATIRLTVTSPWVRSISPRSGRTNALITVSGSNFGATRGSSWIRAGATVISSYSFWSNTTIRFRIPVNTRSGNLYVSTSEGRSNSISLEVTSPYLGWVSPTRVSPGDRLTLTGGNFGSARGLGYVLFTLNVRPSSGDYVSWSDSRIVVEVPARAKTGDVRVVTARGSSGTRRIEVEGEDLEPLPSTGIFGYSPPELTEHPKSVKFGFVGAEHDLIVSWFLKNDAEVGLFVNVRDYGSMPVRTEWQLWYTTLLQSELNSGQNVIEFRNQANQDRTSNYAQLAVDGSEAVEALRCQAGCRRPAPVSLVASCRDRAGPSPRPSTPRSPSPSAPRPPARSAFPSTTWLDSGSASCATPGPRPGPTRRAGMAGLIQAQTPGQGYIVYCSRLEPSPSLPGWC